MFEDLVSRDDLRSRDDPPAVEPTRPVSAEMIASWIAGLARLDRQVDDAGGSPGWSCWSG